MIGKKINQLATELAPVSTDLTIIGDPTTGVSKKITLAQLGAIFSGAVSFYTNLAGFPATGDINVIYCAKDTQKLYLWSGSAYTEVFPSQALLDTYQLRSEKGVSNGYASLDSSGKVPISQLPSSIMEYKGTWNAATNTPTLANGTGDTGDVYICNVAGTVNFGAGPITFAVGDYVIYSGSIWQRSSGAVGTVTSVAASITGNAIGITGSPVTTSGTLAFAFAGTGAQYIKGDGTLATFPSTIAQAERLITEVYNSTGATLTKGTIVYINGGQGNLPTVTKALATGDSTSAQTFGVVQADITNNNNGYVVVAGKLSDLDTQAYTEGTQLYLSATTAGTWTSTKQYAPNHLVYVGIVVRAHPTQGIVEIKIQNGYELDELHDVAAQNPDNNDILQYKTSTSLWTKVAGTTSNIAEGSNLYYTDARSRAALSFTAGSGAYNSTTGVITIPTNTNQLTNGAAYITLASLSAGAGISYNNTTGVIASTITQYTDAMARASISGGTGISYNSTTGVITNTITQYTDAMARASISLTTTGTSGAATYNSTTGVLNVPQYAPDLSGYVPTSRTLTINGTAYDLSANRSWSVGTVTSVGLSSATSGVTIGSTPVTTSGTITLAIATASGSQQGLLSSTDWTTFNNKQNALTNPVTGTGTTNYLPKFTGTSTIGNSSASDNGTTFDVSIQGKFTGGSGARILTLNAPTDGGSLTFESGGTAYADMGSNKAILGTGSATNFYIGTRAGSTLTFGTANTARLFLDTSGNLGLGVTPSAWSLLTALQISGGAILAGYGGATYLGQNFYYGSGGDTYISNGYSTRYTQFNGQHLFFTASSGTAGNAISFTQAMTLNASGNLSIGNTNDTYKLDVSGTGRFNTNGNALRLNSTSNDVWATFIPETGHAWRWQARTTSQFSIYNETLGVFPFTIESTGAATFSNYVTIGNSSTTPAILTLYPSASAKGWQITANNYVASALEFTPATANGGTTFTTPALTIASTGAATFSSSVAAGGDVTLSGNESYLYFTSTYLVGSNTRAKIRTVGAGGGSGYGGDLRFSTRNSSNVWNEDAMTINSAGNLGIGTTSPSYKFQVQTASGINSEFRDNAGNALAINLNTGVANLLATYEVTATNMDISFTPTTSSGVQNEAMRIKAGGNVGIGTTSPADILDVTRSSASNSAGGISLTNTDNSGYGAALNWNLKLNSTAGVWGRVYVEAASSTATFMSFQTTVGGTLAERMRINSAGNVGIGTTSPSYRLVVNSGTDGISAGISGSTYGIRFDNGGTFSSGMSTIHGVDATLTGSYQPIMLNGLDVRFGTSATERMRITSSGNVGIGTTDTTNGILNLNGVLDINKDSTTVGARWRRGATTVGYIGTGDWAVNGLGTSDFGISSGSTGALVFGTVAGSERMRITSGGDVAIGDTSSSARLWARRTDDGNTFGVRATNATYSATVGFFGADRNTTNNSFYYIDCYNYGSSSYRFRVADSGNITSAGSIQTGAPFLGTAKPWKLGAVYTGTCVPTSWGEFASWATGTVIEVEIDGSTYRIPVVVDNYC